MWSKLTKYEKILINFTSKENFIFIIKFYYNINEKNILS